jgi:hypothetical protein
VIEKPSRRNAVRRIVIIAGVGLVGAVLWAAIFGLSLIVDADDPDDFFEQATFRTEKVVAVAGAAAADGFCTQVKDANGVSQSQGTSYRIDVTWTGRDGERRTGEMTTCEPPAEGAEVTVWVTSRNAVFNRSPLAMYSSVPIAAVVCAAGAWGWTWVRKSDRRPGRPAAGPSARLRRLKRARSRRR